LPSNEVGNGEMGNGEVACHPAQVPVPSTTGLIAHVYLLDLDRLFLCLSKFIFLLCAVIGKRFLSVVYY